MQEFLQLCLNSYPSRLRINLACEVSGIEYWVEAFKTKGENILDRPMNKESPGVSSSKKIATWIIVRTTV